MSDKDNGGMAFPMYFQGDVQPQGGMTLRDYFAAKVMASWIVASQEFNGEEESHRDHLSSIAYAQADSMLAERAK